MLIIDTPYNTSGKLADLAKAGVKVVIRYYNFSNSGKLPQKRLELAEAQKICAAGMHLMVVFQQRQNQRVDFSFAAGLEAGYHAASYARNNIGQPAGSAIYFSVDFDASAQEIDSDIIPYFKGVAQAFAEAGHAGHPVYRVGVYGSGLVGAELTQAGFVSLVWLSQSKAYRGTAAALKNQTYHLAQNFPATFVAGLGVDTNHLCPGIDQVADIGAFKIQEEIFLAGADVPSQQGQRYEVISRLGLRLREGPGTSHDVIGYLAPGQQVYVLSTSDGWACVDVEGDGKADGFAALGLLTLV